MTARFTPPRLGFIDTASLRLQVSVLLSSLMAFAAAGKVSAVLKTSLAMRRAYKSIMRAQVRADDASTTTPGEMTPRYNLARTGQEILRKLINLTYADGKIFGSKL